MSQSVGRGLLGSIANSQLALRTPPTEQILEHLRYVLNTCRGDAATDLEYGILSMVDLRHSYPDSVELMRECLVETIRRYELRLRNIVVTAIEHTNPFVLRFDITAEILTPKATQEACFHASIGPVGHVDLW